MYARTAARQVHDESSTDIPRRSQLSRADGANVPRHGGEDGVPSSAKSHIPGVHERRTTMAAEL